MVCEALEKMHTRQDNLPDTASSCTCNTYPQVIYACLTTCTCPLQRDTYAIRCSGPRLRSLMISYG
jgi:hypothetical protein